MAFDSAKQRYTAGQTHFAAYLRWNGLTYMTKPNNNKPSRALLYNVSGIVKPGEFLAIMGPSGAGKTILLNTLSGKKQDLIKENGDVLLNGRNIETLQYKSMIGVVPQEDILIETLTPVESLRYAAHFTINVDADLKEKLIQQCIEELGLTGCKDTIIGGVLRRGLSGGEKKRVSIGLEIIYNPSVLFLDEPTTGLDSYTALSIVQLLKYLAEVKGRTIIASIQANSQMFATFDRLLLLSGGRTAYMGPAKDAVGYFADIGYPLPNNYNPADHFLNVLNLPDYKQRLEDSNIRASWSNRRMDEEDKDLAQEEKAVEPESHYVAGFWYGLWILVCRSFLDLKRNPVFVKTKLYKLFLTIGLFLMCFTDLPSRGQAAGSDRNGLMFAMIATLYIEAHTFVLSTFNTQKKVFLREYRVEKYGIVAYFISYNITMLPIEFAWNFAYMAISYYIIGLNPLPEHYFILCCVCVLVSMSGTSWSQFLVIATGRIDLATSATQLVLNPFMLGSGFLVNFENLPDWFFPKYVSPYNYAFQMATRNEFHDLKSIDHPHERLKSLHLPQGLEEAACIMLGLIIFIRIFNACLFKYMHRNF